jgi:hypothetical protein
VVATLSAKYTGKGDRQYLPDADPAFDVVYPVSDDMATGRLRELITPLNVLSTHCPTRHDLRHERAFSPLTRRVVMPPGGLLAAGWAPVAWAGAR